MYLSLVLLSIMIFYFSGASGYCIFLILKMFQDRECSKTDLVSWIVIALASLLWVVVIPISIWEIQAKAKTRQARNTHRLQDNHLITDC